MPKGAESAAHYYSFDSGFIDFDRGIRVGLLDPSQRVTQIFKTLLSERHGVDMVCDRWGRGVYWQWICWVPKANRDAKPLSSGYNFASAKFFISTDRENRTFQSGLQVERAPKSGAASDVTLEKDWDWHVLLAALKQPALPRIISRLLGEGFRVRVGAFGGLTEYNRRRAQRFAPREWGGFQLFYPMPEKELRQTSGAELIQAAIAVFDEVAPAMNLCMYAPCLKKPSSA